MNILETKNLRFSYKNKEVLKGMDLAIPKGSIYGYLGKNGAGKSTTIKLLLGLLSTAESSIFFEENEFSKNRERILFQVGNLIESTSYYSDLNGREHLEYLDIIFKKGRRRIDDILHLVGLSDAKNLKVKKYSTGMKQRLGIAMAMFHDPDFLILDEPLNGLDPAGVHDMREVMIRLQQEGKTILLSSHILGEVEKTCTHIGIVDNGELLFQGELCDLLSDISRKLEIRTSDPIETHHLLNQNNIKTELLNEGHIIVYIHNDQEHNHAIRLLVDHHVDIYSIDTREKDLESVYLNLISK